MNLFIFNYISISVGEGEWWDYGNESSGKRSVGAREGGRKTAVRGLQGRGKKTWWSMECVWCICRVWHAEYHRYSRMVSIPPHGEKSWASGGLVDRTEGWVPWRNLWRMMRQILGTSVNTAVDSHWALDPYCIPLSLTLSKPPNLGTSQGKLGGDHKLRVSAIQIEWGAK